uniref:hypothetical protein n=1 Tax=Rhodococcus rhodochrous TaxID=1829 RepID=UPI000A6E05FF
VVDIFNRVNSGGAKLSKGDLALASLCAQWPPARQEMRDHLTVWKKAGSDFTLDWLLRNATAVATGSELFTALSNVKRTSSNAPSRRRLRTSVRSWTRSPASSVSTMTES